MKQIKLVDVPKSELRMIEVGGQYWSKVGWMGADGLSGRNRPLEEPSCKLPGTRLCAEICAKMPASMTTLSSILALSSQMIVSTLFWSMSTSSADMGLGADRDGQIL